MIHFQAWQRHNGAAIRDVEGKRRSRKAGNVDAPITLYRVLLSTNLDADFTAFARAVGGRQAETFFTRCLQYAANKSGRWGIIDVAPENFGVLVLSRDYDIVSGADGQACHDALLSSGICEPGYPAGYTTGTPAVADTAEPRGTPRGRNPTPSPTPSPTPEEKPPFGGHGGAPSAVGKDTPDARLAALAALAGARDASAAVRERAARCLAAARAGNLADADFDGIRIAVFANTNARVAYLTAGGSK